MKKKISVFTLLLSLLLAVLVPAAAPVPVQAEEVDVDKLLNEACIALVNNDTLTNLLLERKYYVIGYNYTSASVELVVVSEGVEAVSINYIYKGIYLCNANGANVTGEMWIYEGNTWVMDSSGAVGIGYNESIVPKVCASSFDYIVNLANSEGIPTVFEYVAGYTFASWCSDAGLNCYASSNESDSVIPYSYNDYWHIVRKTSSGKWLLTTIGSTIGQAKMNLRLSEDLGSMILYEYSGDDSFTISVRQYVYDTDGWKLRSYDTYDYDDFSSGLLTLPAGFGFDDTRILAYTSTDIYASDGLSVYAAASTEYIEPSAPDVTPESTPGSGSSGSGGSDDTGSDNSGSSGGGRPGSGTRPSVGGEASGGGGLDFIINLFTLIWTKICSVPMSVDGYSISLQQIFVYGALVSIVGGFIIKFIFRR